MSTVSSNQQYQDPAWLADFLQKHADDEIKVTQGPGGMTISVAGESVFIGPSQMGVLGTFKGTFVQTNAITASDPFLMLPQTVSFTLTPTWINYFVNFISPPEPQDQDGFGFNVGGGDTPIDSGLTMSVPSDLTSTDKSVVLKALTKFTGLDTNPGLTADQKASFSDILDQMASQIASGNKNGPIKELASGDAQEISNYLTGLVPSNHLSDDDKAILESTLSSAASTITSNEYLSGLQDKDPKEVLSALMSFTGIDKDPALDGNPTERKALLDKLTDLANAIAKQNASGKPDPALLSFDPKTIGTYLLSQVDLSSLPKTDQILFTNYVSQAAGSMGSLNAVSGQPLPKTALMQNMESTDPAVVQTALQGMLSAQGLSDSDIASLKDNLLALATTIATKNGSPDGSGLDITDADTLKQVLTNLLGASTVAGNDLLLKAIASIATAFAAENTNYYSILAKSGDATVVFDALRHLSNIDHNPNLTPQEKQMALDYLKLMATALAFMSQIRAKVSMLEAELRKQESSGKLATIKDQTQAAQHTFTTGIDKIQKDLQSMLDALAMKALMKILGPIIMVIIAIIMAIITIFSFGTAAPVAAAIMVAVIVVMTVLAIADQAGEIFKKMSESMGVKSKEGQEGIAAAIQAIIMAIACVVTFGAASVMFGALRGAQAAIQAVQKVLKELFGNMTKKLMQQFIMFFVGQAMNILMSSGLLTDGLTKMFKAMGMNDHDAEIASMVTTMILMLAMMVAMVACAGNAAGAGANAAKDAAETGAGAGGAAAAQIEQEADAAAEAAKAAAKASAAGGGVGSATQIAAEDASESVMVKVTQQLQRILARMEELAKNPETYLKVAQSIAMLMQIASGLANAVNEFGQAKLSEAQATLTLANSQTQALLDFLKQVIPTFDMTQQDIDADSKDFMKTIEDFFNLFANMVSSASAITTQTAQTA